MTPRALAAGLVLLALVLIEASTASADPLSFIGCFQADGAGGCTAPDPGALGGAEGVAVSPDGTSVYVGASGSTAVTAFDRALDGTLTSTSCLSNHTRHGCVLGDHKSLDQPTELAMSPDGASLYVLGERRDTLTTLAASPEGGMGYEDCLAPEGSYGCQSFPGDQNPLSYPTGIAVSPNGTSVYVAGNAEGTIASLTRAGDGSLTYDGCLTGYTAEGCKRVKHYVFGIPRSVLVSPDGESVYLGGGETVVWFSRAPDGSLTAAGCLYDSPKCDDPGHEIWPWDMAISPDGETLYVEEFHAVIAYSLAPDGAPEYLGCVSDKDEAGCRHAPPHLLGGLYELEVSPDGGSVWVAGSYSTVARFKRKVDGSLSFSDCIRDKRLDGPAACASTGHNSIGESEGIALGPDGHTAYVTAGDQRTLTILGG